MVYKVKGNPEKEKENIVCKSRIQWAHLEANSSEKLLILVHGYPSGNCLASLSPLSSPLWVFHVLWGADLAWFQSPSSPAPSAHPDYGCLTLWADPGPKLTWERWGLTNLPTGNHHHSSLPTTVSQQASLDSHAALDQLIKHPQRAPGGQEAPSFASRAL